MKKLIALILAVVMIFSLASCASQPAETPAEPSSPAEPASPAAPVDPDLGWNPDNIGSHTFILAHGLPATGMTGIQYHEFAVAVDELSGGKIKIEERIGGTLVTDTETFDAMLDGTIDLCHSMASYVSGTVTDISPLTVPGSFAGDDWLGFIEESFDLIDSIYGDYGIKYLGAVAQGNTMIVNTDKQIRVPSDFTGQTIRASGTWVAKTVEAWGGAPVTIGVADLADAFSKKTVQGVPTGLNIIVPFKIYEVSEYYTMTDMCEGFAGLLMSQKSWNTLNDDEKALFTEAGKIFTETSYELANKFKDEYLKEIEDNGLSDIHYLTDEEQAEFTKISFDMFDEMSPSLGDKGNELIDILKGIAGQ